MEYTYNHFQKTFQLVNKKMKMFLQDQDSLKIIYKKKKRLNNRD